MFFKRETGKAAKRSGRSHEGGGNDHPARIQLLQMRRTRVESLVQHTRTKPAHSDFRSRQVMSMLVVIAISSSETKTDCDDDRVASSLVSGKGTTLVSMKSLSRFAVSFFNIKKIDKRCFLFLQSFESNEVKELMQYKKSKRE